VSLTHVFAARVVADAHVPGASAPSVVAGRASDAASDAAMPRASVPLRYADVARVVGCFIAAASTVPSFGGTYARSTTPRSRPGNSPVTKSKEDERANLNSILLGSDNPKRLAAYYTRLFGTPGWVEGGDTAWQFGVSAL
jgi:hypothetical protein